MTALESNFLVPGGTVLVVLVVVALLGLLVMSAIGAAIWLVIRRQGRAAAGHPYDPPVA